MQQYLECSLVVSIDHPTVVAKALELVADDVVETARRCFEWVRDEIRHVCDYGIDDIACAASEVLEVGAGFCYAKSHLLVALLRANAIPGGVCYQRLRYSEEDPRFVLHGLVAVHLPGFGWYRIDPRGNKPGVDARFDPPYERLAFALSSPGEVDFPEIWPEPLPVVVEFLRGCGSLAEAVERLPDVEPG